MLKSQKEEMRLSRPRQSTNEGHSTPHLKSQAYLALSSCRPQEKSENRLNIAELCAELSCHHHSLSILICHLRASSSEWDVQWCIGYSTLASSTSGSSGSMDSVYTVLKGSWTDQNHSHSFCRCKILRSFVLER